MDKVTLDAVMEEIKKSLGEARLMKIFEDDPEDKVIKQEPKTSATPSSQEDQNKTGTSPATAGSQPQSTMASPGDRAAFDAKTGADKTRADAGAAELAQRTLKPLVPGGSTAPSAPGAVRPLSAPSAPIKPITGPTPPGAGAKPVSAPADAAAKPEKFSGTIKDFQAKNAGATVGQAMNAIQGKTAIAGGKNDPSVIQKGYDATSGGRTRAYDPAAGASAPKPAAPAAPAAPKSAPAPAAPAVAAALAKAQSRSAGTDDSGNQKAPSAPAVAAAQQQRNTELLSKNQSNIDDLKKAQKKNPVDLSNVSENFDQFVKKFLKESK